MDSTSRLLHFGVGSVVPDEADGIRGFELGVLHVEMYGYIYIYQLIYEW
jgi:hypothetical protein